MKRILILFALLGSATLFQSCGNANKDSVGQANDMNTNKDSSSAMNAMDESDSKFMVEAANTGMTEIEMGKMAQEKGMDPAIKSYGAMMVRDHTKAADELKALAMQKNVTLPTALSDDMQKHVMDMGQKSGKEFDKDYIGMMQNDHKDVISNFEKTAENGKDADLRAWCSSTLMTLRMHLDSVNYIAKSMKM